jgi:hypothetical protein
MSSGRVLKDLTDLVDAVARELKVQDEDTVERERIAEDLNDLLHDIASRKRWLWLQGHVDIQFKPYYGAGTVSLTPDSTTVTFSVAPSVSLGSFAGRYFSPDNFNEIYIIDTHTAGSTSATLKSAYTGALTTTAAFKVWTDQVALPTDCRETVEVWHDFANEPLEPIGHQELRKRQAESSKAQARPIYYTTYDFADPSPSDDETESDRYRVMKVHPAIYQDSTTLHIDYVKEVPALVDDGDEPPMPMEDRIVLVYGARMMAWMRHRNPEAAEMNRQRYEDKLARMMGKVEEGVDKPQLTPDSLYVSRKRGNRLKSLRGANSSGGGGGSYTSPSYLSGATINGATITGNVTVSSGITIDGRDISADGAALDSHLASGSAHDASEIVNTPSGSLAATNVQDALNELQTDVNTRALDADLDAHTTDAVDAHDASAISVTPSGNLAADDVQEALVELQTELDTATAHIADATDAHAASAITNTPSGNLAATTVQAALNELQGDIDAHLADTTDAHDASAISSVASGNLAATDVQSALNELQTDVDGRQARSTLTAKGDLYVATASATVTRLAVGANGTFLKANSSATEGVEWGSATANLAVASKTGAYTLTTSDDVILADASGGAFTLTLPTASGNTGKVFHLKKTDSSTNAVTVDGNGTETIDGATTFLLTGQYSEISIVSDGTNWVITTLSMTDRKSSSATLANYPIAASTFGDLTSLSLTAGSWLVDALAVFFSNGAVTTVGVGIGVSTTSGNSDTGLTIGDNYVLGRKNTSTGTYDSLTISDYLVTPTSTTTYYLKVLAESSVTNLRVGYRISARRIR